MKKILSVIMIVSLFGLLSTPANACSNQDTKCKAEKATKQYQDELAKRWKSTLTIYTKDKINENNDLLKTVLVNAKSYSKSQDSKYYIEERKRQVVEIERLIKEDNTNMKNRLAKRNREIDTLVKNYK